MPVKDECATEFARSQIEFQKTALDVVFIAVSEQNAHAVCFDNFFVAKLVSVAVAFYAVKSFVAHQIAERA